jgi:6-phosphogluconolactonase (cycloisomerase 2 family)
MRSLLVPVVVSAAAFLTAGCPQGPALPDGGQEGFLYVNINPTNAGAAANGGTVPFTASPTPGVSTQGAVSWAITQDGGGSCAPGCGTLGSFTAASVVYSAPATVPTPANLTLMATVVFVYNAAQLAESGTASITVTPASDAGTDGGSGNDGGSGFDGGTPLQVGRYLYSTDAQTGRVTIHTINAATGQLRFGGSVVVNPASPTDNTANVVLSPSGVFLYAADTDINELYGFVLSPDGQLHSLGITQPVGAANRLATVLAVASERMFLYAFAGGSLWVATINPLSGQLENLISSTPPGMITPMAFDSLGRYAYFGINTGIEAYAIDAGSGALAALSGSPISAGQAGSYSLIIAVSPNGSFLYAVNPNDDKIYAFAIAATGALTELGAASTGNLPSALAIDPASHYVFVANEADSTVSPYVIQADGTLSPQTTVPSGADPTVLAVDPSGDFLYVADQTGSAAAYTGIQTFRISPNTTSNAILTAVQAIGEPEVFSLALQGGSTGVTYSPQFLYAAGEGNGTVSAYQVDPTLGALTPVLGSPYSTPGAGPTSIATDLLGRFVYAPSAFGNPAPFPGFTITSSGTSAGALTPVAGMPYTGLDSKGVVVEPSGSFAYVTNSTNNAISEYALDPTTGLLTALVGSPFIIPNGGNGSPSAIAVSPFGFTLFVTNTSIDTVSALTILASGNDAGTLMNFTNSPIATTPSGSLDPVAVAVDPSNRFVYVANMTGQTIAAYQFNDLNQFAPIAGSQFIFTIPTIAGSTPTSMAIEPTGRFLYVSVIGTSSAGVVVSYGIDPTTGALSEIGTPLIVPAQGGTVGGPLYGTLVGLTAEPSGKFLYAALNNESAEGASILVQFDIDPTLGTLTLETLTYPTAYGPAAISVTATVQ